MMHKAIFLDRDGVINKDYGYVGKISDFEFLPKVVTSLAKLKAQGWLLVLVTNQSGIARGMYTEADFWTLTEYMQGELAKEQAEFDKVYFCPHHPDAKVEAYRKECDCRKPKPGMFLQAARDLDLDLASSIMVGDHASDLVAASAAGIKKLVLVGEHLSTELLKCPQAESYTDLASFVEQVSV